MIPAPPRGLYAITTESLQPPAELLQRVEQAILGGAALIQYRDKTTQADLRLEQATALRGLCGEYGVPIIINDDPTLAKAVGAAGVHLGKQDTGLEEARQLLGPSAIIGVSCYDQLERAMAAEEAGASYVAFGRFFPSLTKPRAKAADPQLLRRARAALKVPICAIGGITPENGAELLAAGADLLAVVHGVFAAQDVRTAAARYAALFCR
jgi:thiamine-phosphate pyrophosphorylase